MAKVDFVDTTLRDGPQSLWATRMRTAHMLGVTELIDNCGYRAVELMGAVHFDACLRYLREDPWERVRLICEAMPNTKVGALIRSKCLTSFSVVPDSIVRLWVQRCAANGLRRLMIFDALHDWSNIKNAVETARECGIEIVVPLVYSISPVHTDEFYARKAREMVRDLNPDVVLIKDSIGLLTPDRIRTLVPTIKKQIGALPLEMHAHCTTGLAPLCCLESVDLGVDAITTCAKPLANGPSHPSIENMEMNLRRLGHEPNIDIDSARQVSDHFAWIAAREGKPVGSPVEYDVFQYSHQVPGGMISNLEFMLGQRNMGHRLDEVLNEVSRIREEWGYPVMITPFSQLVGTQAVLNVLSKERYATTTEEGLHFVLGHYGQTPAPVDSNVLDKMLSLPGNRKMLDWEQPQPSIEDVRRDLKLGDVDDDEFLLRALFTQEHVEATRAAGPICRDYAKSDTPEITLIRELAQRDDYQQVSVEKEGFSLTMRRNT